MAQEDGQNTDIRPKARFFWSSWKIGTIETLNAVALYLAGVLTGKGEDLFWWGVLVFALYTAGKNIAERSQPTDHN